MTRNSSYLHTFVCFFVCFLQVSDTDTPGFLSLLIVILFWNASWMLAGYLLAYWLHKWLQTSTVYICISKNITLCWQMMKTLTVSTMLSVIKRNKDRCLWHKSWRCYQLRENVKLRLFIMKKCARMESSQTHDRDLTRHCPRGYLTGQRSQEFCRRWYLFH